MELPSSPFELEDFNPYVNPIDGLILQKEKLNNDTNNNSKDHKGLINPLLFLGLDPLEAAPLGSVEDSFAKQDRKISLQSAVTNKKKKKKKI